LDQKDQVIIKKELDEFESGDDSKGASENMSITYSYHQPQEQLAPGTILNQKYVVRSKVGSGTFG
jgi:hypothetical protein